jgi:hypothetical protein
MNPLPISFYSYTLLSNPSLFNRLLTYQTIAKYVLPLQKSMTPQMDMRVTDQLTIGPALAMGSDGVNMLLKYLNENYCSCDYA